MKQAGELPRIDLPTLEILDDEQVRSLLKRAREGDADARRQMVEHNLRLVMSIIGRFEGRAESDDLFQIGCIGLLKAIDRFDLSHEVRFSTYAVPVIIGEIRQFLRGDGPVKVGRTLKEHATRVRFTAGQLTQELGREPTVAEIARQMSIPNDEVAAALEVLQPVRSLSEPLQDVEGDPLLLEDKIPAQNEESMWLEHQALQEALELLNERYQTLLRMRYFEEKTQSEVADVLGVSQVQICRLEKQALQKLNEILRE